ncbi:unnamed protein product [Malus baccata var. baccata]
MIFWTIFSPQRFYYYPSSSSQTSSAYAARLSRHSTRLCTWNQTSRLDIIDSPRGCLLLLQTSLSRKPSKMPSTCANLNFSRIAMTSPVLTSTDPEAGPLHSLAYFVRFYLPTKFQTTAPTPLPELNLKSYTWDSHYLAIRKFSKLAKDSNIMNKAEKPRHQLKYVVGTISQIIDMPIELPTLQKSS